jgi:hypothetical protein
VREVFLASGVTVPIAVVGIEAGLRPVSPVLGGEFRLLSMFHWSARKNPAALIRAYCAAFDGRQDTVLVIKAHLTTDVAQPGVQLGRMIGGVLAGMRARPGLPRIELVAQLTASDQVRGLQAGAHAYVSLSHGEGWGLPAWEAALQGRPVLHTGWSSPNEFVAAHGQLRHNLAPVYGMTDFAPFYDTGMRWADPHLDDAVDKLRDLHTNYSAWAQRARSHRDGLLDRYGLPARLAQLRQALGIPAGYDL